MFYYDSIVKTRTPSDSPESILRKWILLPLFLCTFWLSSRTTTLINELKRLPVMKWIGIIKIMLACPFTDKWRRLVDVKTFLCRPGQETRFSNNPWWWWGDWWWTECLMFCPITSHHWLARSIALSPSFTHSLGHHNLSHRDMRHTVLQTRLTT